MRLGLPAVAVASVVVRCSSLSPVCAFGSSLLGRRSSGRAPPSSVSARRALAGDARVRHLAPASLGASIRCGQAPGLVRRLRFAPLLTTPSPPSPPGSARRFANRIAPPTPHPGGARLQRAGDLVETPAGGTASVAPLATSLRSVGRRGSVAVVFSTLCVDI